MRTGMILLAAIVVSSSFLGEQTPGVDRGFCWKTLPGRKPNAC